MLHFLLSLTLMFTDEKIRDKELLLVESSLICSKIGKHPLQSAEICG